MTPKSGDRFVWIDDNPSRKHMAVALQDTLRIRVDFLDVRNKDIEPALKVLRSQQRPALVIIDHILDTRSEALMTKGSTVAELLRETWSSCPIVGITGAERRQRVDIYKERMYEELYSAGDFGEHSECVKSIAAGFRRVSRLTARGKTIAGSLERLTGVPPEDRVRFGRSLPGDLLADGAKDMLGRRFYAWLRDVFFARPGFLYDRLWVATMTGLNEKGFAKLGHVFDNAKYSGVFACPKKERWWGSLVKARLYQLCPSDGVQLPWELGRKLKGVGEPDLSKCYASGEACPETVAYIDESSDERHPMRLRHTVPHPRYPAILYFEDIRMMGEGM